VILFGALPAEVTGPGDLLRLVQELARALGREIRVVHGREVGHVGVFAERDGAGYAPSTVLVPGLLAALALLARCEDGEVLLLETPGDTAS
jgi:hypothetical protein